MKNLPLGYQDFKKIRDEDKLYVDKTDLIWKLVNSGQVYFLSRPRRFGKSLLLSILECFFKGEKQLFEGLAIAGKDYDWKVHPVVFLRMNAVSTDSISEINFTILQQLTGIAEQYDVELIKTKSASAVFWDLIKKLYQRLGPVVVLIDEYDKPLLDQLGKEDTAREKRANLKYAGKVQNFLKRFYGKLKPADSMLKFLFITGVSKFTRTSIFSELNHLTDISMMDDYAALLGYTQAELEYYFDDNIAELKTCFPHVENMLELIRLWYNGYRFTEQPVSVYNPYSILSFFNAKRFRNFWYETGTPTFLINLIREKNYPIQFNEGELLSSTAFTTWDLDNLALLPLMFQTGYLTIQDVVPDPTSEDLDMLYRLDFPNKEVRQSLLNGILVSLTDRKQGDTEPMIVAMRLALRDDNLDKFFDVMKSLIASIGYGLHIADEHYYHSIFYVVFKLIGMQPRAEEQTNQGRIDMVAELTDRIYIFEFKLDKSVNMAMRQIHQKKYYEKFRYLNKALRLVGVAINSKKREVTKWKVEEC